MRIVPLIPLIKHGADDSVSSECIADAHLGSESAEQLQLDCTWNVSCADNNADTGNSNTQDELVVIADIHDMYNNTITNLLLSNMVQLHGILENIKKDSQDRCFNAYDVPIMQLSSLKQTLITDDNVSENTDVNHLELLRKHLASFNLRIDPVIRDGDCAFRSITVQVQKPRRGMTRDQLFIFTAFTWGLEEVLMKMCSICDNFLLIVSKATTTTKC